MRKSLSISALVVIFISELAGLFGILSLRYCMDVQVSLYDSMIEEVFEAQNDVEELRSLLYKYEFNMTSIINSSEAADDRLQMELRESELEIRKQLIIHGKLMKTIKLDRQKAELFRSVNDAAFDYLNYNAVLLLMKGQESHDELKSFTDTFIIPLMESVNINVNTLSLISKNYIEEAQRELDDYLSRSRVFSIVGMIVIVFSIIVSVCYSYKVFQDLEKNNNFLKFKSEVNEIRISEIQNNTIIGIADLVESRSGETGQHVKRTSHLVNLILMQAKRRNKWPEVLTERYIDFVTRAAPMHDIGKIVISDAILNKPGKLTDEEYEIMKTHAEAGAKIVYQILGGIEDIQYVEIAADIANYHHEKWNGKGYPTGKKESEIPLCARVMAVADVFDALVSERCYKKPMKYEDAFELIKNEAGQHFDPEVVELFLELKDGIMAEK